VLAWPCKQREVTVSYLKNTLNHDVREVVMLFRQLHTRELRTLSGVSCRAELVLQPMASPPRHYHHLSFTHISLQTSQHDSHGLLAYVIKTRHMWSATVLVRACLLTWTSKRSPRGPTANELQAVHIGSEPTIKMIDGELVRM
jgi:hypothetical protein